MTDTSERLTLTLRVLRRYLPSVTHIIATTSICQLYRGTISTETGMSWEKLEIAGSSFLCASSSPEAYHLIILNRRGLDNFVWTLRSTEFIEDDGTFLIFNDTSGFCPLPGFKIDDRSCWGIWVYPNPSMPDERDRMRKSLLECAKLAEEKVKEAEEAKKNGGASLAGYSIMEQVLGRPPPQSPPGAPAAALPQNGGDILGQLFENARQRGPHGGN